MDLSLAEIPVVIPSLASIETVKGVSKDDSLFSTIIDNPNSLVRSSVNARHIKPRPYLAIKLIASGVAFSEAIIKSPSFSRSSSSTIIIIFP